MYQIKEIGPETSTEKHGNSTTLSLIILLCLSNLSDWIFLVKMLLLRITFHQKFRSQIMLTNRIQSFVNKKFMNFNQMSLFV